MPAASPSTRLETLRLDAIELDDETFRFRAALRLGPLKESLNLEGQQVPIIVRDVGTSAMSMYQIISGFRRVRSLQDLGIQTVSAVVRTDLDDDELAFRTSVLENSNRKTYSDIDRALVIRRYEEEGHSTVDVADLMGLSTRQKNNLRALLDLPASVQAAIDDPDSHFGATHALVLRQLAGKHGDLDYEHWVHVVAAGNDGQGLSVAQLKRHVNAHFRGQREEDRSSLFRASETNPGKGVFRLQPMRIEVAKLTENEKDGLRAELSSLLAALS
jgi:ParB/RepB/Spo0J family partition protein